MSDVHTFSTAAAQEQSARCLALAAPLVNASLRHFGVRVRDEVAIVGVGSAAQLGVTLAKSLGARVTVLGLQPGQREEARRLGADSFITLYGPDAYLNHAGRFRVILNTHQDTQTEDYRALLQTDGLILKMDHSAERVLRVA